MRRVVGTHLRADDHRNPRLATSVLSTGTAFSASGTAFSASSASSAFASAGGSVRNGGLRYVRYHSCYYY